MSQHPVTTESVLGGPLEANMEEWSQMKGHLCFPSVFFLYYIESIVFMTYAKTWEYFVRKYVKNT